MLKVNVELRNITLGDVQSGQSTNKREEPSQSRRQSSNKDTPQGSEHRETYSHRKYEFSFGWKLLLLYFILTHGYIFEYI